MKEKEIEVSTIDGKLFSEILHYVVKNNKGEYSIFLKDIAQMLQIDIKELNEFIILDEQSFISTNVPFIPIERVDRNESYKYVVSGKNYILSEDDLFSVNQQERALQFILLSYIRLGKAQFNEIKAVNFATVCMDCIRQAHLVK